MHIHSAEKIKELKRLRKRGYSLNELVIKLSIPKSTVWHHVHDIQILPKYISILRTKRGDNTKRMQRNWEKAREYAQKLLQGPSRDLSIAIAMLYWSEGTKKKCEFINSDGMMIKSYLNILRKILNVPEERIKPTLRIFSKMNRKQCLNYWSRITKIPKSKFIIRLNDGGTRGRTKYGMCRITVKKGGDVLKLLHSLINQVSEEIIKR